MRLVANQAGMSVENNWLVRLGLVALVGVLAGCYEPPQVRKYTTKHEEPYSPITFETPENWLARFPTNTLTLLNFAVSDNGRPAKMTVTTLGGMGGDLLANVNRWRRQIQLPPVKEEELSDSVKPTKVDGHPGQYVMLDGPGGSIFGVIVPRGSKTWFFKLMGSTEVVKSQQATFDKFLSSVRFNESRGS